MSDTIGTDLSSFVAPTYRGHIDLIDPDEGVRGWALDLAAPALPVGLELLVGEIIVARTMSDRLREDISDIIGQIVSPGFAFDADALAQASDLAASPDDVITVRVAGTNLRLGFAEPPFVVAQLATLAQAAPAGGWLPARTTGQAHGAKIFIDRILVVSGFGCLVEGWVLSPLCRIVGMELCLGGAVMPALPEATYWKPRLDLVAAYPGSDTLAERAGFAAVFAQQAAPPAFTDPLLKLLFAGGAEAVISVPARTIRLFGHATGLEEAQAFFPALREEPFFPRFAMAAARADRDAMKPPVSLACVPTPSTLIFVLPEERDDLFLLFEILAGQCRRAPLPGLTLVASAGANRADAPWLLRDLQKSHAIPASLLLLDDAQHAFALLPALLRQVQARRFVFVGAGVFLTDIGWQAARAYLSAGSSTLAFLGLPPDPRDPAGGISARCFGWTTERFAAWSETATHFLGGYHGDNGLAGADRSHVVHRSAARAVRDLAPGPLMQAANQVMLDTIADG